jgi:hypothetical protein
MGGVSGAIPFTTYSALTGSGTGFAGQLATVTTDTSAWLNGLYVSDGTAWFLIDSKVNTVTPTAGSGFTVAGGKITQKGPTVELNQQFTKSSSIAIGDTVGTLPTGYRPTSIVVISGATTTGLNQNSASVQIATTGVITVNHVAASAATSLWISGSFKNV